MKNLNVFITESFHFSKLGEMLKGKDALTQGNIVRELKKIHGLEVKKTDTGIFGNSGQDTYGVVFSTDMTKNFAHGTIWRMKRKNGSICYELLFSYFKVKKVRGVIHEDSGESIIRRYTTLAGLIKSVKALLKGYV